MKREFKRPQIHNIEYEEYTQNRENAITDRTNEKNNELLKERNSSKNFIKVSSER